MATLRTATSPSLTTILRFASSTPTSTRRCARCLRAQRCPFSSFAPIRQSSKRPLMTETARAQTLEPEMPPPPRNDGVPETSIAGQQQQRRPPSAPWERKDSRKGVSEREGEAQKSKPTAAATSQSSSTSTSSATQSTTTTPPKKKSKLRPRKSPITLTPAAVEQLVALHEQPESKLIRIGVKNRGCSGLAYHLEYVDKPGAFDEEVKVRRDGKAQGEGDEEAVKVLIDSKALFSIIGSEMDWVEDKLQARFVFRNPNITEQCGCGESFSIS